MVQIRQEKIRIREDRHRQRMTKMGKLRSFPQCQKSTVGWT